VISVSVSAGASQVMTAGVRRESHKQKQNRNNYKALY
jgi:hypothetical protein